MKAVYASMVDNDRKTRVYQRPGERFLAGCVSKTVNYDGLSCMVLAGIFLEAKSNRYIQEILEEDFIGEHFLFSIT